MKIYALFLPMALVQGGRICTNPKGNDGESYTEGCLKMTCKSGGVWRSSLDTSICCYNKQPYFPNTTINASKDGCTTVILYCRQEDDVATAVLQVENNCGKYSTEEQVQELKHLLLKHMEQTDCDKDSPAPTSTTSTTTNPTHETKGVTGKKKPEITIRQSTPIAYVGGSIDIFCNVGGSPSRGTTIKWSKVGQSDLADNIQIYEYIYIQSKENMIRITGLTKQNEGLYRCTVDSRAGTFYEMFTLSVQRSA